MGEPTAIDDMIARYARRRSRLRRFLRPPNPFIYNPRESFLPATPGPRLFIGGAGGVIPEGFLSVDLVYWPSVGVVADAHAMPFLKSTVEAIECDAVLEHVVDPPQVIAEFRRVLKSQGYLHVVVPFHHPYHAYPDDYHRWSLDGLRALLRGFELIDLGVRTGPSATLLLYILEYVRLLAPRRVRGLACLAAGWVVWPLRYLDTWLLRSRDAHILANSIYVLARRSKD